MASSDDVRSVLLAKHALVTKNDYFALLEVGEDAPAEDVKAAYFQLVKLLHPDRLARAGVDDMKEEANLVFRTLTTAYNTLVDAQARAAYMVRRRESSAGTASPAQSAQDSAEDVRIYKHRGELMLKRRAYAEAEQFFRKALETSKDDSSIYIKLGQAVFHNTDVPENRRLEEARRLWEKAQDLSDNRAEALFHLAMYWKAKGDARQVETFLQDALSLQPGFVEAKRELRLLLMRRRNDRQRGFFDKLKSVLTKKR